MTNQQEPVSSSELSEEEVTTAKTTPRQRAMAAKAVGSKSKPTKSPTKPPRKAVSAETHHSPPLTSLDSPLLTTFRPYSTCSYPFRHPSPQRMDLARFTSGRLYCTLPATQGQGQGRVRPIRSVLISLRPNVNVPETSPRAIGKSAGVIFAFLRRWSRA